MRNKRRLMAQEVSTETSKEKIYKDIRSDIINGRLRPGARLAVHELASRYGISITPVRDALQMLGQEGLVSIRPRSGYFVTRITLKELRDLLDMREILELAAVERAARRIDPEQIVALQAVHSGYTGDDDASYTRYTDENRRFHCLLAQASGNQELADTLRRLHERLARFMVIRHAGKDLPDIHGKLIERLLKQDRVGAKQVLEEELRETRRAILERVMTEEAGNWEVS